MLQPFIYIPASVSTLLNNLVAYWKLDEGSGTRVDSHGSNNLTDNGSVGSATGKIGNAASFDGANLLEATSSSFADVGAGDNLSISLWVHIDPSNSLAFVLNKRGTSGQGYDLLYVGSSGELRWRLDDGTTTFQVTHTVSTNTWYHVVVSIDRATNIAAFYLDTVKLTTSIAGMGGLSNTRPLRLAARELNQVELTGLIDETALYSRVLTDGSGGEVSQLYNSGGAVTYPF
jgi:hypothetical protein